jgi:serine/threonine protein phosphatase PrpC
MKRSGKPLNYSYFESKYIKDKEKDPNSNAVIKRSEKRHKTQIGIMPKNFQLLINKSLLNNEKEKQIEKKIKRENKYENDKSNTINISHNRFRKYNSTQALPNFLTYNINKYVDTSGNTIQKPEKKLTLKKSKTQLISTNKYDINTFRRNPNFPKYERRMSDKFIIRIDKQKQEPKQKEEPKENFKTIENQNRTFVKKRRKSIGAGIRNYGKKENQMNKEFRKITYVKTSQALSEPGLDEGHKKINQDAFVLEKNINGILNFNIFGVLDGHGDFGHLASNFVKRYIINKIKNHPMIKSIDNTKEIYKRIKNKEYQIITNIFLDADNQIKNEKFNCEMSGTTCVLVIQLDEHLICANAGDSRAILIYDDNSNNNLKNTKIFNLSNDAKPENPGEKERIIASGGEVERMVDENGLGVGPLRVWVKGEQYPGIAMSRSIGDMDAKKVGVIPNPEFIEYVIDSKTKYMLVCSDGVFEFLSNEEVMEIGNNFYSRNDALGLCYELINKSTNLWLKEDDTYIDDITVVSVFF